MIKVIAFDFDGVIVDSYALKRQVFFDIFSDFNPRAVEVTENVLSYMSGKTRFDIIRQILVDLGNVADNAAIGDYAKKYNEKTQQGIMVAGLKKGVLETLGMLSGNYNLYINSGTPEAALKESVEKLGITKFFKNIYGRPMFGEFVACKEANLRKIMADEAASCNEVLMIGDEDGDRQAAKNCNCFFVGVANGADYWKGAEFPLVSNFNEIINVISLFNYE